MEDKATHEMESHVNTMDSTVDLEKTDPNLNFSDCKRQDNTLDKCFDMTTKSELRKSKNGKWSFEVKNGILTRCFSDKNTTHRQLVIPSAYIDKILKTAYDIHAKHDNTGRYTTHSNVAILLARLQQRHQAIL